MCKVTVGMSAFSRMASMRGAITGRQRNDSMKRTRRYLAASAAPPNAAANQNSPPAEKAAPTANKEFRVIKEVIPSSRRNGRRVFPNIFLSVVCI